MVFSGCLRPLSGTLLLDYIAWTWRSLTERIPRIHLCPHSQKQPTQVHSEEQVHC